MLYRGLAEAFNYIATALYADKYELFGRLIALPSGDEESTRVVVGIIITKLENHSGTEDD